MPLSPAIRARQFSAVPTPKGETRPIPVTATRRRAGGLKIVVERLAGCGERRWWWSVLVAGVALDICDRFLDLADLLRLFVRDLDAELLLESHHPLDDVERIGAQVVGEAGVGRDFVLVHPELLDDDVLDLLRYICHRSDPPVWFGRTGRA